jgi:glutathione S-transferase
MSDTGFLLGRTEPSYVDLALFVELLELSEDDHVPDFADVFHLPRLGALLETTRALPRIDAYLKSPRRMPRYARPGYVYV